MSNRSRGFIATIKSLHASGWTIDKIAESKRITREEIDQILAEPRKGRFVKNQSFKRLGHKDEPYYETEDELFNNHNYTYEDLSPEEKKIYESRNNK